MNKPLKVYVASSWRNDEQPRIVRALRDAGFDVYDFRNQISAFSWRDVGPGRERHGKYSWTRGEFTLAVRHPIAQRAFEVDIKALQECDICVLSVPCGRSAHLETGYAVGAGKFTVIYLNEDWEPGDPELMYLMANAIVTSMGQVVKTCMGYRERMEGLE